MHFLCVFAKSSFLNTFKNSKEKTTFLAFSQRIFYFIMKFYHKLTCWTLSVPFHFIIWMRTTALYNLLTSMLSYRKVFAVWHDEIYIFIYTEESCDSTFYLIWRCCVVWWILHAKVKSKYFSPICRLRFVLFRTSISKYDDTFSAVSENWVNLGWCPVKGLICVTAFMRSCCWENFFTRIILHLSFN